MLLDIINYESRKDRQYTDNILMIYYYLATIIVINLKLRVITINYESSKKAPITMPFFIFIRLP